MKTNKKEKNIKNAKNIKNIKKNNNKKNNNKKINERGTSIDIDKSINKVKKKISKKKKGVKIESKFRFFIFVFSFLVIISLIVVIFFTDIFTVKNIKIIGNTIYTDEQILNATNKTIGKNIFIYDRNIDNGSYTKTPYVEKYNINIKLPNTIVINVVERESKFFAYDKEKNIYYRLDKNGYVLEIIEVKDIVNKALEGGIYLYGITFNDETLLGNKINNIDEEKLKKYIEIENKYFKNEFDMKITKVSLDKTLTTITFDDKLNVIFPFDTDIQYKLVLLKNILNEISEKKGVIDLTKTSPTYSNVY